MADLTFNDSETSSASETLFATDAFSSGQVGSKLWLCEELEKCLSIKKPETVWVYGGWHGVLGFMMLARDSNPSSPRYAQIRSFDIDANCEKRANTLCENWVWRQWKFRAFTADCNLLNPENGEEFGSPPSVIINTSVEHFDQRDWFEKIPAGTLVALQASDFEHDGAVSLFTSEEKMREAFPLSKVMFSGRLKFDYDSWSFHRLMLIGIR